MAFTREEVERAVRFVNTEVDRDVLGWVGTALVIVGSSLLAFHTTFSKWGWWAYLASSIVLVIRSDRRRDWSMLVQQWVFVVVNIFGLYRWFF